MEQDEQFKIIVFGDTSFGEILKDIYVDKKNLNRDLDAMITELRLQIKKPSDALLFVPLLEGYLNKKLQNNEQIIKMAAIVQKALARNTVHTETSTILSDSEWAQIQLLATEQGNTLFNKKLDPLKLDGSKPTTE